MVNKIYTCYQYVYHVEPNLNNVFCITVLVKEMYKLISVIKKYD